MNAKKEKYALTTEKQLSAAVPETFLPAALADRFDFYPENKRRPVNKTLFRNEYFQLNYNVKNHTMSVSSRGDIVYSAIPYDTARNYIQRAAIQYLLHPEAVRHYIESHKTNLENYLALSIFQTTQKRVAKDSLEVKTAYQAIFEHPLFEIQILGRLLQHDETGPLSANLAGKFLYSENVKTGISEYLSEYLRFVVAVTQNLPIATDGKVVHVLEHTFEHPSVLADPTTNFLTVDSTVGHALDLLPGQLKQAIEHSLVPVIPKETPRQKPLLRSEFGKALSDVRQNYQAHSIAPKKLAQYFENVHATENTHQINVVSDIHATDGTLPFDNHYFNILGGDVSNSQVENAHIEGIYVIGNQELLDVLPLADELDDTSWDQWRPFFEEKWFQTLVNNPEESWYRLPTGDHPYYEQVASELKKRFPKMHILHNCSMIHKGVRYIGLTIPVALTKRKKAQQTFIFQTLKKLLAEQPDLPTVIVSHAPLFNELSLLSPKSRAHNQGYSCSEPQINKLFDTHEIIGVIHGHHHIPASSGRYKEVAFAGKKLFVVCSIYSQLNTGFDLTTLLDEKN